MKGTGLFELVLLGGARVIGPDGPLQGSLAQRRQLGLLAFLALQSGRPVSRDRVLAVLWPEADTVGARHSLADSLYQIRRTLGTAAVRSIGDDLLLNPEILPSDVAAFEDALGRGDLAAAVAVNGGELLDGFHLPENLEFEHWLELERTRLARALVQALETLAARAAEQQDWKGATEHWRRASLLEPADSRIAAGYVRALLASGSRAAAIAHVRAHEALLREEFGTEAGPEVQAALDERLAARVTPARELSSHNPPEPAEPPSAPAAAGQGQRRDRDSPAHDGHFSGTPPPRPRPSRRRQLQVGLAAAALPLLFLTALGLREPAPTLLADRFAVNVLANRSGDESLDFLGFAAASHVARALIHAGIGDVINYSEAGDFTVRSSARALALEASAGTVVDGGYRLQGDTVEFHLQILDARADRSEAVLGPIRASVRDPEPAFEELARRVLGVLGARASLPAGFNPIHDMGYLRSPIAEAQRAYYIGMERFFVYDMEGAIQRFTRAHDLDSTFLAPLIFMAVAHMNLEQQSRARPLRDKLLEHYDRLTIGEQLQVDWLDATLSGNGQAFQRAMLVAERYPHSPFAYQASRHSVAGNRPVEALRLLSRLDSTLYWVPTWPGYWQLLTAAHHQLGEHEREAELVRQMPANVAQPVRSLSYKARAFGAIGAIAELNEVLEQAATLPTDQVSPGEVARVAAVELQAHGFPEEAARVFDWALAWYRSRPSDEHVGLRMELGRVLYESGRLAEAEAHFNSFSGSEIVRRGFLGVIAARRGDRAEALAVDEWLEEQGSDATIRWRARIAVRLGDLEAALALLGTLPGTFINVEHHRDPDYEPLRSHPGFQQLLRPNG